MSESDSHSDFMRHWVRTQARIYAYLRSLIFARSDADDVLQEVASVLWRKFEEFQPGTRFDHWALRVAHNQVLYYRQKKRRDSLVFSETLLDDMTRDTIANRGPDGDYFDALDKCLTKLASDNQELVRRRHQPGETNRSIARHIGKSESAISRSLNRIYVALLHCIESTLEGDVVLGGRE